MPPTASINVPKPGQESAKIRAMFDSIAHRYDMLNHLLSGWTDVAWRQLVARETVKPQFRRILDLACGTGDLALEMRKIAHRDCQIIGADFTGAMLRHAATKTSPENRSTMAWVEGDGLCLPFPNDSFDLVTIAFGIRNMESLEAGMKEMLRVTRPGGTVAILEFSQPENSLIRNLFLPYFVHVLPRVAGLLSQGSAYRYLSHSVMHFPGRHELARRLRAAGYQRVRHCALTFGIAAVHIGYKADKS